MDEHEQEEQGAFRFTDPSTSKRAARTVKVGPIMMKILRHLRAVGIPQNGAEISDALGMPTITVVPRLCPLRDDHRLIRQEGERINLKSGKAQIAYVLTERGIELIERAPTSPRENV